MKEKLKELEINSVGDISSAPDSVTLNDIRVKYLGKKGLLTGILSGLGSLPPEERREMGALANTLKTSIEGAISAKGAELKDSELKTALEKDRIDITLPGRASSKGTIHPLTRGMQEVIDIFTGMGFSVEEGPEIESDYYNFEALNIPKDHPARDMQDTFYITEETILRTHTSPVQIHTMEKVQPPVMSIAPGKVYRCDADITHSPMFHQVEGFMVDKDITFGHLQGVLHTFIQTFFGEGTKVRFRPSFFPFTEPSAEVDISCLICGGVGCRVCSGTGWLEVLGSGMIDPEVFKAVGYDPEVWSGFAFGVGIERLVMLKYRINDIRLLFENDTRFLTKF
ncbi:MAG: phenylalanine--tRNA ligase subunit alpha [Nitrospinae bacterium]|nr:phenylalanine--tRNA ligase subunit alpha [Nitrospinota bacterium]